jgi:hypothetical protein
MTISELVNFKRKGSGRRDLKKLSVSRIFPNPAIRNVNDKKAIQKYKILDSLSHLDLLSHKVYYLEHQMTL